MGKIPENLTFYFIGVTTAKSSIMKLFPLWIRELELPRTRIEGYDVEPGGCAGCFREIVQHIKENEKAVGALVTTHKIDVVRSAWDIFDYFDEYAEVLREVSCISKRNGTLRGHAKDPITAGRALESFLPRRYWENNRPAQVFIIGAGGAGIALSIYLMRNAHKRNVPSRIIISDTQRSRLEHCWSVHGVLGRSTEVAYVQAGVDTTNIEVLKRLPAGSLVVNATGMGKDRPGSPLPEEAMFPENGYVWDFNYRGSLEFLHQAETQKDQRSLSVEDGWTYFVNGWAVVMGEVFGREITEKDVAHLSAVADQVRTKNSD